MSTPSSLSFYYIVNDSRILVDHVLNTTLRSKELINGSVRNVHTGTHISLYSYV